ncbi:MAG: DUF1580 domain-containing protein, partial [Pirellula sp.]|nr:DUF1580 domain-containing protein [Pirellula sp.]
MSVSKANRNTEDIVRRVLSEDVLTIAQARTELAQLVGKRPDKATICRWIMRGVAGVKLEAVKIGPNWVTSMQA